MKNVSTSDVMQLLQAIAWPMGLLVVALIFRKGFTSFLENLPQRIAKLSLPGGISIDFAQVTNAAPSGHAAFLSYGGPELVGRPASDGSVWIPDLLSPLHSGGYVIIDLGTGRNWLTSRLFLFAAMLSRAKRIRSFVFLETSGTYRDAYVGSMFPDRIRLIMANTCPWFERAYGNAYFRSTFFRPQLAEDYGTATSYEISTFLDSVRVSTSLTRKDFADDPFGNFPTFRSVVQSKIDDSGSVLNKLSPEITSKIAELASNTGYVGFDSIVSLLGEILLTEHLFEADLCEPWIQRDLVDAARQFPESELASYANRAILGAALDPFVKPVPFRFRIVGDRAEPEAGDWIRLRRDSPMDPVATWEHASWLTAAEVETLFTGALMTSKILARDLVLQSTQDQTRLIVRSRDDLVAVTDEQRRFERLYDRHDIVERFVRLQAD
jgi:hypothetical protein